jgi:hypothetical protein
MPHINPISIDAHHLARELVSRAPDALGNWRSPKGRPSGGGVRSPGKRRAKACQYLPANAGTERHRSKLATEIRATSPPLAQASMTN